MVRDVCQTYTLDITTWLNRMFLSGILRKTTSCQSCEILAVDLAVDLAVAFRADNREGVTTDVGGGQTASPPDIRELSRVLWHQRQKSNSKNVRECHGGAADPPPPNPGDKFQIRKPKPPWYVYYSKFELHPPKFGSGLDL